jgi:nucleoid DNA-binding protein
MLNITIAEEMPLPGELFCHAHNASGRSSSMTKADLARAIYDRHGGLTNQEALTIVDILLESIKERLLNGESVYIVGFGTFEIVERKPRRGRNPMTGEEIQLRRHHTLVFRPSRSIREV